MATFFTSDTHFSHRSLVAKGHRKFNSVEEMDDTLIRNWNRVVSPQDTVFHLGDFVWKPSALVPIRRSLNGTIHLVLGNHDRATARAARKDPSLFGMVESSMEITVDGIFIVLFHYALRVWNKSHYGSWHLYGHSHGSLPDDQHALSLDVGVDPWEFKPVSMDQLRSRMALKSFKPVDHHRPQPHIPA